MRTILKRGDVGDDVKMLQEKLGIETDGHFGSKTESAVRNFQGSYGLVIDGIVGPTTQIKMFGAELQDELDSETTIYPFSLNYMDSNEYSHGPCDPEYIFIHHTAGWHNPYRTINHWNNDSRGRVGTEFVIGGQSIKGNDDEFDGDIVKCIPDGAWAGHLGRTGSYDMHRNSVGIEVNNFGYLTKGGYRGEVRGKRTWIKGDPDKFYTYVGTVAHPNQVCDLGYEFKGYQYWHNYTDNQIESLRNLIMFISNRNDIDVSIGLAEWLETEKPADAFEFKKDAWSGEVKGILSHSNVRKGKSDMYPHPKLVEMLKSLKQN